MAEYCRSIIGCLLSVGVILLVVGCAESSSTGNATVQGTVTVDGSLAPRGTVTFFPKKDGPVAIGQIYSDGSYALRIGLGNTKNPDAAKIPAGEYVATVMVMGDSVEGERVSEDGPPLAGPRLVARKYTSRETSGLEFSVKPGRNVFVLELESAAFDPPEISTEEEDGSGSDTADKEKGNNEESNAVISREFTDGKQVGNSAQKQTEKGTSGGQVGTSPELPADAEEAGTP